MVRVARDADSLARLLDRKRLPGNRHRPVSIAWLAGIRRDAVTAPGPPLTWKVARVGEIAYVQGAEAILLIEPPARFRTYSSPCSSSPKEEMLSAVSSSTVCVLPSHTKISPECLQRRAIHNYRR